jgi:hypothetical protein
MVTRAAGDAAPPEGSLPVPVQRWEGGRSRGWTDPTLLGQPFAGRAALLSPFDRLVGTLDDLPG